MVDKQLEKFKDFVRQHPGLKTLVRTGDASWQSLFEEWYLYGDSDSQWEKYKKDNIEKKPAEKEKATKSKPATKAKEKDKEKEESTSSTINGTEMMNQALQYIQKMDMNKVQQTMGTVQQFIQIFQSMQGGKSSGGQSNQPKQTYPGLFSKFDD